MFFAATIVYLFVYHLGETSPENAVKTVATEEIENRTNQIKSRNTNLAVIGAVKSLDKRISELESRSDHPQQEVSDDESSPDARVETYNESELFAEALQKKEKIDQSFEYESRDESWANEMESQAMQLFEKGQFVDANIVSSECKNTFCRMEVNHKTSKGALDFERIMELYSGGGYVQHLENNSDGSSNTVVYLIRREKRNDNYIYKMMHPQTM